MPASDAAFFTAECLSMAICMVVGLGTIANCVLAQTKGHDFGLGFIAIGFGLAFYIPIQMFGAISAAMNPAFLLAQVCGADPNSIAANTVQACCKQSPSFAYLIRIIPVINSKCTSNTRHTQAIPFQ